MNTGLRFSRILMTIEIYANRCESWSYARWRGLPSRDSNNVAQSNSDGITIQRARIYHPVVDTGACRLTLRVGVSRWNACLTKDQVCEMCGNACCLIYAYTPPCILRALLPAALAWSRSTVVVAADGWRIMFPTRAFFSRVKQVCFKKIHRFSAEWRK